jgi:hypothetical protein
MKIKKIISTFLVVCLLFNGISLSNITAKAAVNEADNVVYVDGLGFTSTLDDAGNLTVRSLSSGANNAFITINKDGNAIARVINDSKVENYTLNIDEMNSKKLDIDVYQNNRKVKEYSNLNEIQYDKYVEQEAMGNYFVYSLSLLIEVLVYLAIMVIIYSVTYYAICEVIDMVRTIALEEKSNNYYYYRATRVGANVNIDAYNPITLTQATSRLATGADVYTFFSGGAALACSEGGGLVGPEIDQDRRSGWIYFYHFHINRSNPSHAFFGYPYTL